MNGFKKAVLFFKVILKQNKSNVSWLNRKFQDWDGESPVPKKLKLGKL